MPTYLQAGDYSQVLHYPKAVTAANNRNADRVMAKMRRLPVHDFFSENGYVRTDGRTVHDTSLARVRTPTEAKGEWDLCKILATVRGDQAFRLLGEGGCPLVRTWGRT